jgi:hypothetical protein
LPVSLISASLCSVEADDSSTGRRFVRRFRPQQGLACRAKVEPFQAGCFSGFGSGRHPRSARNDEQKSTRSRMDCGGFRPLTFRPCVGHEGSSQERWSRVQCAGLRDARDFLCTMLFPPGLIRRRLEWTDRERPCGARHRSTRANGTRTGEARAHIQTSISARRWACCLACKRDVRCGR